MIYRMEKDWNQKWTIPKGTSSCLIENMIIKYQRIQDHILSGNNDKLIILFMEKIMKSPLTIW